MAIGVSFLDGVSPDAGGDDEQRKQLAFQEAIKLLNMRLPRITGANAIAPSALLNAPQQGPGMNSALQMQALMAMAGMGAPRGNAPAPVIGIGQGLPPGFAPGGGAGPITPGGPPLMPPNPVAGPRAVRPSGPPLMPPNPVGPKKPGGGRPVTLGGPPLMPPNPVGAAPKKPRNVSPPGPRNLPLPRVRTVSI